MIKDRLLPWRCRQAAADGKAAPRAHSDRKAHVARSNERFKNADLITPCQ